MPTKIEAESAHEFFTAMSVMLIDQQAQIFTLLSICKDTLLKDSGMQEAEFTHIVNERMKQERQRAVDKFNAYTLEARISNIGDQ